MFKIFQGFHLVEAYQKKKKEIREQKKAQREAFSDENPEEPLLDSTIQITEE